MDANTPRHEDNLSDIEGQLAQWRPGADGLDADAMLFAAGLAAGRRGRGRLLGPALCGLLAILAAGLAAWGLAERSERQALASRLRQRQPSPDPAAVTDVAAITKSSYEPSPNDYLSIRRQMEQDPDRWLASQQSNGPKVSGPPLAQPEILTPRPRDGSFVP